MDAKANEKMPISTAIALGRKKRAELAAHAVVLSFIEVDEAAAYYRVTERDVIKHMFAVSGQ